MESLKQFMGFLLIGTVVWLAWVLGQQGGSDAVIILLVSLLLVSIGSWILGRWAVLHNRTGTRIIARAAALVFIISAAVFGIELLGDQNQTGNSDKIAWESFSEERLAQLRRDGKAVFIDFTAAWCLSCKVNERVALETTDVAEKFAELDITPLKADWTSRDKNITRALAKFGRNSVPLYVLYGEGIDSEAIILPEILTPRIVLESLERVQINKKS